MIEKLMDALAHEWAVPHRAVHRGELIKFALHCLFDPQGASDAELKSVSAQIPADLERFWRKAASARLFEDVAYGQWGLEIFRPEDSMARTKKNETHHRPGDFSSGDLVIGRFLGDSDLLVIRTDRLTEDYGSILIASSLDPRSDWYLAARSLEDFLVELQNTSGDKFWEQDERSS